MDSFERRKRVKTTPLDSSPCAWTKKDVFLILVGIVAYEDETNSSYRSDYDALYAFIKGSIGADFTKEQLRSKIKKLKKKFASQLSESGDAQGTCFANTHEAEIFELSMAIWGKPSQTASASNVSADVPEQITQTVEQGEKHEQQIIEDEDAEKTEELEQQNIEDLEDVDSAQHEQITEDVQQAEVVTNVENAKVGENELCVLQDTLEAMVFPTLGEVHMELLLQNLKNIEAEKGKELSEEWKALLVEEMKLKIRKLTYSAKLAEALV